MIIDFSDVQRATLFQEAFFLGAKRKQGYNIISKTAKPLPSMLNCGGFFFFMRAVR